MQLVNKAINLILREYEIKTLSAEEKSIYLTFDDGPEAGITEFVLKELDKYQYKGTFFCRGDNAEKNPQLLSLLREKGHSIGNHTYSHLHAYDISTKDYVADVERADSVLQAELFRPPHGSLTLSTFNKLHKKYKLYFWSLNSGDSDLEKFDYQKQINNLKSNTKPGDIVLFHFCHRHENETRLLLPEYLKWLNGQGYKCKSI